MGHRAWSGSTSPTLENPHTQVFDFIDGPLRIIRNLPVEARLEAKVTTRCQLDLMLWLRDVVIQVRQPQAFTRCTTRSDLSIGSV